MSVQDDIAGKDPGANSPQGLVASVDLKDAYFHIHSTASQMLSEVCSRGHSIPVPCSPV